MGTAGATEAATGATEGAKPFIYASKCLLREAFFYIFTPKEGNKNKPVLECKPQCNGSCLFVIASLRSNLAFMSSRGTKRSRLLGDGKQRKERLPRFTASCQSTLWVSRGTKQSRLYWGGKQKKERLPRFTASCQSTPWVSRGTKRSRLWAMVNREKRDCHASQHLVIASLRSNLAFIGAASREKRDCRAAKRLVKAPSGCREARSDLACLASANTEQRDCHASLAMTGFSALRSQ